MNKPKVAIAGGAGYTGGELIRLLLNHPNLEIGQVLSNSQSGKYVSDVHYDLVGKTNLVFQSELDEDFEIIFLCMGHGHSADFLNKNPQLSDKIVIDLSNEFRLTGSHDFVYGLPEWQKEKIKSSRHIANPGCFATAIQLGLLPLANLGLLKDSIHVHAITGATGAGQKPGPTTHFAWRTDNISSYKTFTHQHEPEIVQSLTALTKSDIPEIYFVPIRGDFARGIYATIYTKCDESLDNLYQAYASYYNDHPFVQLSSEVLFLKQVTNTNNCFLHIQREKDMVVISSVIDNLVKGASGQAIQNANLIMKYPETAGLELKANYF